jgi:hypothetical protein
VPSSVFNGDVGEALALNAEGYQLLCPKCGSEVIVAKDLEAGNRYQVHPGLHCTGPEHHVLALFNLSETREHFKALFERIGLQRKDPEQD